MVKIFVSLICFVLYFNVYSQTIAFTYTGSNGSTTLCNPAVVNFTPVYTGNPIGFTWYFGNGQTSNSAIPSMTYTTGTYVVKLVAVFSNMAVETMQTIVVNPGITVDFIGNANYICKLDTVGFTASTVSANVNYLYTFNDGTPPVTSTSNSIVHSFAAFGLFNTTVKATNIFGCTNTDSFLVEVKKPPITGIVGPLNGCAPINANFTSSVIVPLGSTVTNYAWSFGDGTITNTNSGVVSHPYTDSGNYVPTLTITTSQGCTNTYTFADLNYGIQPQILYAYPKQLTYCGNEAAQLVAVANFATSYKWEFGDGAVIFTSDTIVSHKYNLLGPQIVKVTPINNECEGQPFTFTINIIGVIASYKYSNSCTSKNTFSFINTSQGNQSFKEWIFGDGSPNVYTNNAIHTYPANGTFNTMLIVGDDITGCRDSIDYPIFTATPSLVNPDTFVCRKSQTTFTVASNYANPFLGYNWNVLSLPSNADSIMPYTVRANNFGNFPQAFVILNNGTQYCPDTVRLNQSIRVGGPELSFSTDTSFCTNNNFVILNSSIPHQPSDSIKSWRWTFGIPNLVDTAYQPSVFVYSAEGTYPITLIAKDKKACIDTLIKNILVKESPFLRIFPRSAELCLGQTITLTGYHTDTMVWSPASWVNCATCDTTFATPLNSAIIYAIASNANCSLKDSTIITVYKPFTARASPDIAYACVNEKVNVFISPADKKIVWSPGFGLSSDSIYNPVITVLKDTNYLVTLTDSSGCYTSSTTVKIRPYPQPKVNAGPDRILSYNSPFTITPTYSNDVTNYLWTPGNFLNCSICPRPSGVADSSRTFVIRASNANNCVAIDTIKIMIECAYANLYMASAFSPDNINVKKYYYPQTRGIKMINRFAVFNRYGEVIYEIKNAQPNIRYNGWDGKFKGIDQITGGYVYMLDATCEKGELLTKKGSFVLIR